MLVTTKLSMATVADLLNSSMSIDVSGIGSLKGPCTWQRFCYAPFAVPTLLQKAIRARPVAGLHFIKEKFCQKFCRLSVPPKSVVKLVESTSTMSPARC